MYPQHFLVKKSDAILIVAWIQYYNKVAHSTDSTFTHWGITLILKTTTHYSDSGSQESELQNSKT